jgi:hypothetical protein
MVDRRGGIVSFKPIIAGLPCREVVVRVKSGNHNRIMQDEVVIRGLAIKIWTDRPECFHVTSLNLYKQTMKLF